MALALMTSYLGSGGVGQGLRPSLRVDAVCSSLGLYSHEVLGLASKAFRQHDSHPRAVNPPIPAAIRSDSTRTTDLTAQLHHIWSLRAGYGATPGQVVWTAANSSHDWIRRMFLAATMAPDSVQSQVFHAPTRPEFLKLIIGLGEPTDLWLSDDGAVKLEWRLSDRSLGVYFEPDDRDSGWALAATATSGLTPSFGGFDTLDATMMTSLFAG